MIVEKESERCEENTKRSLRLGMKLQSKSTLLAVKQNVRHWERLRSGGNCRIGLNDQLFLESQQHIRWPGILMCHWELSMLPSGSHAKMDTTCDVPCSACTGTFMVTLSS